VKWKKDSFCISGHFQGFPSHRLQLSLEKEEKKKKKKKKKK